MMSVHAGTEQSTDESESTPAPVQPGLVLVVYTGVNQGHPAGSDTTAGPKPV